MDAALKEYVANHPLLDADEAYVGVQRRPVRDVRCNDLLGVRLIKL